MSGEENIACAQAVLTSIHALGAREIVLCPGRRSAPFVSLLDGTDAFKIFPFFEERNAAFFALGRGKRTGRPVAVITTSGTACAELLPAVIEAYYSGLSLILITCDRPKRLRYTGAPQTIIQPGIFGPYAPVAIDVAPDELGKLPDRAAARPLHINVCFDEPLGAAVNSPYVAPETPAVPADALLPLQGEKLREFLSAEPPLVMVGPLPEGVEESVASFLGRLGAPALLEAPSNLRGDDRLRDCEIFGGNDAARQLLDRGVCRSLLRVGGVPAGRVWRDLDEALSHIPVMSVSHTPFPGIGRGEFIQCDLRDLETFQMPDGAESVDFRNIDLAHANSIEELCEKFPLAEVSCLRRLSTLIPPDADLYLGNSLPIREWDLAASRLVRPRRVEVNRGANGIDGQLSTFFGWVADEGTAGAEAWAIVGDLTALYDLAAPWGVQFSSQEAIRIVIINNFGGQIFSRMFASPLFLNAHAIGFEEWARMWKFDYLQLSQAPSSLSLPQRAVIELRPDSEETGRFWDAYAAAIRKLG